MRLYRSMTEVNRGLQLLAKHLEDAQGLAFRTSDGRIAVRLPDGATTIFVGVAPRSQGTIRVYVGASLPPNGMLDPHVLSRAFGGGTVVRSDRERELRQFSPYGPADVHETPDEAVAWFASRISAARDAAGPPGEQLTSPAQTARPAAADSIDELQALRLRASTLETQNVRLEEALSEQRGSAESVVTNRIGALTAQLAAAEKDRQVVTQLLAEADREQRELETALRDAEEAVRSATQTADISEMENGRLTAELAALRNAPDEPGRMRRMSEAQGADWIYETLRVVARDGVLPEGTWTSILEGAFELLADDRLGLMLGEHYLKVLRYEDAAQVLKSLSTLKPRSAAVLLEATLHLKQTPSDELVLRADWSQSSAADLLTAAIEWLSEDDRLRLTGALVLNEPPTLAEWFTTLEGVVGAYDFQSFHAYWRHASGEDAAQVLLKRSSGRSG